MKDAFIRVAAITPKIKVADCSYNVKQIVKGIKEIALENVSIVVLPELCVTSYTCADLFLRRDLLVNAMDAIIQIAESTQSLDIISVVGFPFDDGSNLYNAAAVLQRGKILGIVPKKNIPNYSEHTEKRYFKQGEPLKVVMLRGEKVLFGTDIIFECVNFQQFRFGVEICEDLWVANSPSIDLALNGANIILNPSASSSVIGKAKYRQSLVKGQSAKLLCGYVYASSGPSESTADLVFSGHNIIAENGVVLGETDLFSHEAISVELDLDRIEFERRKMNFLSATKVYERVRFYTNKQDLMLTRKFDRFPFVPKDEVECAHRCDTIIKIQSYALAKRLEHFGCNKVVLGLSGGFDSTLALIVAVHAFDILGMDKSGIITIIAPCFGTNLNNLNDAKTLSCVYGVRFVQADTEVGERIQVLSDIANKESAIVIESIDMSDLSLGFMVYNWGQVSLYAVNASIPKTLLKSVIKYEANRVREESKTDLANALENVLNNATMYSDLLSLACNEKSKNIEDVVGSYELIDFFLYYYVRFGFSQEKIFRLAKAAFKGKYDNKVIDKQLKVFIEMFFTQQFKRSRTIDGPKTGSVSLSMRGGWEMPSDVSYEDFIN